MRLIRGERGWWCVGPAAAALVDDAMVADGRLTGTGADAVARAGIARRPPSTHYSLTVVTSTACNLGCPYCFQNTAPAAPDRFDPPRIPRRDLTPQVAAETADFVRARMRMSHVDKLHVVLFGGEPLLNPRGGLDLLRSCGGFAAVTATLVTNGVLLRAPLARQLTEHGVRSVQMTVDGRAAVHDTIRTSRGGRGTFATILANLAAAQAATTLAAVLRVNVGPSALSQLDELVDDLAAHVDPGRCGLVLAPVRDFGTGGTYALPTGSAAAGRILAAYARALDRGFGVARPRTAECDFCSTPRGRRGAVVNADGALYSCWETVGRPGEAVGHVRTGYDADGGRRWRRCEDGPGAPNDGPAAAFRDIIDGGLLDLLSRHQSSISGEDNHV